jgi:ABC-type sugar transport system permease subunit
VAPDKATGSVPAPASAVAAAGGAGRGRARAQRRRTTLTGYLFLLPAFALLAFVFAYSIEQLIRYSLHDQGTGGWVGFQNFRILLEDPIFQAAIKHNALLLLVLPVLVVGAVLVAALLNDGVRGWRIYRVLIFVPYMVPVVVAGLVFGVILQLHGLVNVILGDVGLGGLTQSWLGDPHYALPSVGGVISWRELGFGVVLLLARMMQIPTEMYEAARIDGAGWWQSLRYVTVPQLGTIIAFYVGVMVIGLFSWVFNYIFVLTQGGPGVSTYVSEYYIYDRAFGYNQLGIASACAVLLLVFVLVGMFAYFGWLHGRGLF